MRLPLFPLPVVLFPGALMPLHIFEPRYQKLLAHAVEADHRFGILPPGPDPDPPAPGTIGAVARVRAVQPLDDGRSNIVVSGDSRFALKRVLIDPAPYLVGEVAQLDDEPETMVPAPADIDALKSMGIRYAEGLATLSDVEPNSEFTDDAATLSFQVAALLDWDQDTKQHFLEIRSVGERVARLLSTVPKALTILESRAKVHRRASTNGTGHRD